MTGTPGNVTPCKKTHPPASLTMPCRLAHAAVALWYALLMCVAGMLSVLLSVLLLALAVAAKLPIPRIELAVRWVVVKISSVLGDSHCRSVMECA